MKSALIDESRGTALDNHLPALSTTERPAQRELVCFVATRNRRVPYCRLAGGEEDYCGALTSGFHLAWTSELV